MMTTMDTMREVEKDDQAEDIDTYLEENKMMMTTTTRRTTLVMMKLFG